MDRQTKKFNILEMLFLFGIICYVVGIIWINFHGEQWYSFDIYSDMLVAKFMAEQKTFFPTNWIFGNQFYIIATPVLSAIVYSICHNSVLALAIASTVMMFGIIFSFLWCVKPFVQTKSKVWGVFALVGAVILGNSASSYANGMSYFYTMASFYSCYVIVLFVSNGIFFRVVKGISVSKVLIIVSFSFSLALGIQSLRGTLVIYLPLVVYSLIDIKNSRKRGVAYALELLVANITGIGLIKILVVKSAPIISEVAITFNPVEILTNLSHTNSEFLKITGLKFISYGIMWLPLFGCAVFFFGVVICTLVKIIYKKDKSVLARMILLLLLSVLAVYGVGVIMFRVRAIYFFTWYLLVIFSFVYLHENLDFKYGKIVGVVLLMCGGINFIMNFAPDIMKYEPRNSFFETVTEELKSEGIKYVYYDVHTSPLFAVYSRDDIVSGTVYLDTDNKYQGLVYPAECLQPVDYFTNIDEEYSYFILSNWTFDYLEKNVSKEYKAELFEALELVKEKSINNEEFYFYRFKSDFF